MCEFGWREYDLNVSNNDVKAFPLIQSLRFALHTAFAPIVVAPFDLQVSMKITKC